MAQTQVPVGSPIARKAYSSALFTVAQRAPTLANLLTGPAPLAGQTMSKLRGQTSPDMPVVRVNDLSKGAGDQVQVTLFNIIGGAPIMGAQVAEGRGEKLSYSSMDVRIDQYRKPVSAGDQMSQQRTVHDLRQIARTTLQGYMPRLEDQLTFVHLFGARGDQSGIDWVLPSEADASFAQVMVNAVQPPTFNRHYCISANDGSIVQFADGTHGFADGTKVAATDTLKLKTIDEIRGMIDELEFPLQPVKIADDPAKDDEPMYLLLVPPRVFKGWLQDTTTGANMRAMQQNAWARASYGSKHPLFKGEGYMWNNILVKKLSRTVRHAIGSGIRYYTTEAGATLATGTAVANANIERCLLLGAQAVAKAYGRSNQSNFYYDWSEKELDHGDKLEVCAAAMAGFSKVRFEVPNAAGTPVPTDHGAIAIDVAAP